MLRAAGIDPSGLTPGEQHRLADWAAMSGRAPILPAIE